MPTPEPFVEACATGLDATWPVNAPAVVTVTVATTPVFTDATVSTTPFVRVIVSFTW